MQAQPTRSREQNRTAARRILRDRLDYLRATGSLPETQESQVVVEYKPPPLEGKAAKKAGEARVAGMYAKEELKAAKTRLRKVNRAKKHRKKKRDKQGEIEGDKGGDGESDGV